MPILQIKKLRPEKKKKETEAWYSCVQDHIARNWQS